RELALVERTQHLVLLAARQFLEGTPILLAAGRLDLGDRRAIHLLRRERRLVALLRRAFGMWSLAVHLRHAAPAAEKLLVDEVGDAGFLRAGSERVGGNQARHRRVEERDLGRAEKH